MKQKWKRIKKWKRTRRNQAVNQPKQKMKLTRKRKYQQVIEQMSTSQLQSVLKQPSIFVTKMHLAIIKLELRKRSQAMDCNHFRRG
jgi:hypothetical protein